MRALRLASLAWLFLASPAMAGGARPEPYEPIDPQAIIDACRNSAAAGDTTKTLEIRKAEVVKIDDCYTAAILHLVEPMFDPALFSAKDAERLLIKMHSPAFSFYAYLHTWHLKCDCGEDAEIAFRLAALKPYERILMGIGDVRKDYSR
jgi:hypothetical protein